MIVIGYQGIGKAALCRKDNNYIDLESTNFRVDGKRDPEWYKPYCSIAEDLSRQGHTVFVSSHEAVRNRLMESKEFVLAVIPDNTERMRNAWLQKLQDRYNSSGLEKDYRAFTNARERYREDIQKILDMKIPQVVLCSADYDLDEILTDIWKEHQQEELRMSAREQDLEP